MKKLIAAFGLAFILLLTLVPVAFAAGLEDQVVFGGSYTLKEGQTLDGDLVVFGGSASIQEGATVTGDMVILGGWTEIAGEVAGDVVTLGGGVTLADTALIGGDLVTVVGGHLSRAPGAVVEGTVVSGAVFDGLDLEIDRLVLDLRGLETIIVQDRLSRLVEVEHTISALLWSLGLGVLGLLLYLFMPDHLNRVGGATVSNPVASGGIGLLTVFAVPVAAVMLALTIILSPLSVLGVALLVIATLFGWIGLGAVAGQRMMAASVAGGTSPAVAAAIGVFVVTLVTRVLGLAPVIGWVFWIFGGVLALAGLGAVVLTRFGTRAPQPAAASAGATLAGPDAPTTPAEPAEKGSEPLAEPDGE